jgi:hypothetical protein
MGEPLKLYAGYVFGLKLTKDGASNSIVAVSCVAKASVDKAVLEQHFIQNGWNLPREGWNITASLEEIPLENIRQVYESQIDIIDSLPQKGSVIVSGTREEQL